jgi:hypothetical protein
MLRKLTVLTITALLVGLLFGPAVWAECNCVCDYDAAQCQSRVTTRVQQGHMNMLDRWLRIYLYEKDPLTWDALGKGGAWGFLDYRPDGTEFKFLFVGKKLVPSQNYTLIYYPDPWPGNGLICLGSGTADEYGKVKIVGKGDPASPFYSQPVSTGDLPAAYDANAEYGAKIWLVLSSDVDCVTRQMIGWQPTEYLFENTLITFVDNDG